ncbi:hypothetical protein P8R33_05035 [Qipengyuania sp. XHP0211]|uniref:hypothetical protein n=1 Tax=Qipengyuania sp. XHP0211 TaxID=3038079 RepID=UPI00241C5F5B|nr:hypothetical protein [Qipengyuania sp. XHP0211]MDG5750463.1 hypothetical protein [Qipengyuania sp. XHP0211]
MKNASLADTLQVLADDSELTTFSRTLCRISRRALFEGRIHIEDLEDLAAATDGSDLSKEVRELRLLWKNDLLDATLTAALALTENARPSDASTVSETGPSRIAALGHDVLAHADQILIGSPIGLALIELARIEAKHLVELGEGEPLPSDDRSGPISDLLTTFTIQIP